MQAHSFERLVMDILSKEDRFGEKLTDENVEDKHFD
jgi:hypothetical protein